MKPSSRDSVRSSGEPAGAVLRAAVDGRPEAVDAWFRSEYPEVYRLCFGFLAIEIIISISIVCTGCCTIYLVAIGHVHQFRTHSSRIAVINEDEDVTCYRTIQYCSKLRIP